MALRVGTLQVDLVANTASFTGDLGKAGQTARTSARGIQDAFSGIDVSEARGSIMVLGEEIGVHLPRHVQSFVAELPGVATALAAAFPILAVVAIGKAVLEFTEYLKKQNEEMERARQEAFNVAAGFAAHGDALRITNLRLQDQIAILQKKPASNGIAIAMLEAKKAVDDLISEFDKAIGKEDEALKGQRQGMFSKIFNGDSGQNDIIDQAKQFKLTIDDLVQQRTTAELNGFHTTADIYKISLDDRIAAFKDYLATQQTALDGQKHKELGELSDFFLRNNPQVQQTYSTDPQRIEQVNQKYRDRQGILNDLRILTNSFGEQETLVASNNALNIQKETAEIIDLGDKYTKTGVIKKEQQKLDEVSAKGALDAAQALAAYWGKQEQAAARMAIYDDAAAKRSRDIAQRAREGTENDQQQNDSLQVALGYLTERQAIENRLALLEKDKTSALQDSNAALAAQLAKVQQLSNDTMGGLIGSPEEKAAFNQAVADYQQMKQEQLALEKKYNGEISQEQVKLAAGFGSQTRKMLESFDDVNTQLSSLFTHTVTGFTSSLSKFIVEGQGDWRQFAATAIESLIQIELQHLIGLAVAQTVAEKKQLMDAKSAFHGAYAATADIPIIGPVLAPVAGAAAFAAVMAFEQGGIVPNDAFAMVHRKEMVLPQHIANFVMNAAGKSDGSGGSGSGHHVVYAPTLNNVDGKGVDRLLAEHGDKFVNHFFREARRRNIRMN